MKGNNYLEMGWGAPSLKEQHPILSDKDCEHFDRDNQDLSRLVVRGIISRSEAHRARDRYVKKVEAAIREAVSAAPADDEQTPPSAAQAVRL